MKKAFFTGSNTSCRGHIRQHYEFYSKKCKEKKIEESERCVPHEIRRARESKSKVLVQTKLDSAMMGAESAPKQFSPEATLLATTKFIALDDQVMCSQYGGTLTP